MSTAERRQARITALQTLYEVDTTEHTAEEVMLRLFNEPMSESQPEGDPLVEDVRTYARTLVEGTVEHEGALDEIIARSAPNWPVAQMSSIDKNILRLAIFEILFDNRVPLKAAINEAVELGKRFGSDSSSRFINGVLGTVAAEHQQLRRKYNKAAPGATANQE
jgi:N utilization substance protein B